MSGGRKIGSRQPDIPQNRSWRLGILRAEYDGRLKVIEALLVSIILIVIGGYLVHIGVGG